MEPFLYTVDVKWTDTRKGTLCSPELNLEKNNCIEVATPPEFPNGIPGIWSPEHLFTAAVNSCLMTTFLAVAENSKLTYKDFNCKAIGKLEIVDKRYMMTEVILEPTVTISDELDRAKVEKILHKAEAVCLISNSIKSKITMNITIKVS